MVLTWLEANWIDLLQTLGLFFAAVEIRNNTKARRLSNLFSLTKDHRNLWRDSVQDPNFPRILAHDRDLEKEPLSFAETERIKLQILHSKVGFEAFRDGISLSKKGVLADYRDFFSLPAVSATWDKVKSFHDRRFVRFIDDCTSDQRRLSFFRPIRL